MSDIQYEGLRRVSPNASLRSSSEGYAVSRNLRRNLLVSTSYLLTIATGAYVFYHYRFGRIRNNLRLLRTGSRGFVLAALVGVAGCVNNFV